jgi:mannose-1-phosphate guanylyltransferase/mannose-6-phosphate isomerase
MSRSGFPKQFLVLSGDDSTQSPFQQAFSRIHTVTGKNITLGKAIIVTNEEHRFLALD